MELDRYIYIRTGLVLSRKAAVSTEDRYVYRALNLKCITDGKILKDETENYYAAVSLKEEYLCHCNDILLRLSAPYTVAMVTEKECGLLVPSHFAIIRVRSGKSVDPHFLYWWLARNRNMLYKIASGQTVIGTVSTACIAKMNFDPPPIKQQCKIGELLKLANQERELLSSLAIKKQNLLDATIDNLIKGKVQS